MKTLRNLAAALLAGAAPLMAAAPAPALTAFTVGPTTVTASALAGNLSTIWELAWGPDILVMK